MAAAFHQKNAAHAVVTPIVTKPSATATLTVTGGFFANNLHWTYSTNQFDIAAVEIWGSTANNRASASLIAKVPTPTDSYSHNGLSPTVTWYYWIRAVNANGVYSDWYPLSATAGVSGRPSDDPSYLLDQLFGEINTDQIAAELNARIDLIDGPDTTPGTVAANIKTEATTRAAADESLATSITTVSAQSTTNAAAIIAEQTARTNADTALASSISTVQARLDTGDYAAVKTSASASASSITGLSAKYGVQVDAGGRIAGIQLNSSSAGSSSFTVLADNFNVYKPSITGSPVQVFGLGTVNGTTALGLNGQLIVDGSIVARNIAVGQVGTIAIGGNAVTVPSVVSSTSGQEITGSEQSFLVSYITLQQAGWIFASVTAAVEYPVGTVDGRHQLYINGSIVSRTHSGSGYMTSMSLSGAAYLGAGTYEVKYTVYKTDESGWGGRFTAVYDRTMYIQGAMR